LTQAMSVKNVTLLATNVLEQVIINVLNALGISNFMEVSVYLIAHLTMIIITMIIFVISVILIAKLVQIQLSMTVNLV
jgi:uncharacterized membrane protein YczE